MLNKCLFVFLLFHGVLSDGPDKCIRYYFEDYDDMFTRLQCLFSPEWGHESYDNSTIAALNEDSKWFIKAQPPSPSGDMSCTSSFIFTMMSGGVVEANVYFETVEGDNLIFEMMQITETGVHRTAGVTSVSVATGWRVMRVTDWSPFTGNPPFQGYIRFRGRPSNNSVIIVDSFRYVPPSMDSEECILYEVPTTTPTLTPTTTPTITPTIDECVRYYFEDYDDLFTTESPYCDGYSQFWNYGTYDNSTIVAPNKNSKWFIRAIEDIYMGCTSSFLFTIIPGGLVEAYVYLETNANDRLFVDLMQVTETGVHRLAGYTYISGATGWLVMTVRSPTFTGNPPFKGYMRFLGRPSTNSVIIVDSFRYVPPSMGPEEECILYEDFTTPTATPTTPTPTTTPTIPPTTDECVRYYFEDYDNMFTTESPYCDGYLESWSHETYNNSTIVAPNKSSKWFIRAIEDNNIGCTSSFLFTVMPDALVEAYVYLETVASDSLFVDLMQITETGSHRLAGWTHIGAATGWLVITVRNPTFTGNPPFKGYMRFLGHPSTGSVIIVDSFRYIPSTMSPEEECIFYEDFTTAPTASPSTTPTPTPTISPTPTPTTTSTITPTTDECVRYYFEDYDNMFTTESPYCDGYIKSWSLGTYDNSTIVAPNKSSKWFIRAMEANNMGCTSSFLFTVMPDALVEAYLYLETVTSDSLFVDLMQITETGSHRLAGWTHINVATGWLVTTVRSHGFTGNPPFKVYMRFLGNPSADSVMIVDSFRYIPSSMNPEEECILYEDFTTTPTATPTTIPTPTPTTSPTPITDECVRYYFEDYDNMFTTESPYCDGYNKSWSHGTYDNSTIVAPNKSSKWFIRAMETNNMGCTSSFLFTVMPGAIVEAYVYLETVPTDSLFVDLMQLTETGSHRLAGWTFIGSTMGWQVMTVRNPGFTGNPPFQGYMRFLGRPSPNSVMIVDSFRYIPSSMNSEEECILYEDLTTTPTDIPTTTPIDIPTTTPTDIPTTTPTDVPTTTPTDIPTTTPTDIPTTTPIDIPTTTPTDIATTTPTDIPTTTPTYIPTTTPTEISTTTPTDIPTTTPTPTTTLTDKTDDPDECVRYVFEDYDDLFTAEVPNCNILASWRHETYDNSTIAAPNGKSVWFITPSDTLSCTGSFDMTMMPGALVEVIVYLEITTDILIVNLLQRTETGSQIIVGSITVSGWATGWQVLRLRNNVEGTQPFQGYIVFMGSASESSVVIVDSFRYIPLSMNPEEECILYEDATTTSTDTLQRQLQQSI